MTKNKIEMSNGCGPVAILAVVCLLLSCEKGPVNSFYNQYSVLSLLAVSHMLCEDVVLTNSVLKRSYLLHSCTDSMCFEFRCMSAAAGSQHRTFQA